MTELSPEILWPASRQYKNSKGVLIPAFEYSETVKIVCELEAELDQCLTAHAMLNDKVCALEDEKADLVEENHDVKQSFIKLNAHCVQLINDLTKFRSQIVKDREILAKLMLDNGFATGHGDTIEDLAAEFDSQLRSR